jgi:hypothetical protein
MATTHRPILASGAPTDAAAATAFPGQQVARMTIWGAQLLAFGALALLAVALLN